MRLLKIIRHAYLRAMPKKARDPFEITPDQLKAICDQALEDHTGRPSDRGSVSDNLEAMQRRLACQEEDWKFMATCPATDTDPEWVAERMAELRAAIAKTKELIAAYTAMTEQQN